MSTPSSHVHPALVESHSSSTPFTELKCYYTNATSLVQKLDTLKLLIYNFNHPHLLLFTETWFTSETIYDIENYQKFSNSRSNRGGGVIIYVRSDLEAFEYIEKGNESKVLTSKDCEQIWCQITSGHDHILIGCIYRPPPTSKYFHKSTNDAVNNSISKAAKLVENGKFTNFLIVGDFNYPLISWSSLGGALKQRDEAAATFLDTINSNYIAQAVLEPTFKNNQLDLILINNPDSVYNVDIGPPLGHTDKGCLHASLLWNTIFQNEPKATDKLKSFSFAHGDYDAMRAHFSELDWMKLLASHTVEAQYNIFLEHYNQACVKYIPLKRAANLNKTKPVWLNNDIIKASKVKFKLFFKKRKKNPIEKKVELQKQFNDASRKVKKLVFLAVLEYEKSIIKECKNNPKVLYSYINKQKKLKETIRSLRNQNDELTCDKVEIANLLNEQFFSVFSRTPPNHVSPALDPVTSATFSMNSSQVFSTKAVKEKLKALNRFKPAGIDNVHPYVLVECCDTLSIPLSLIFCHSFEAGQIPSLWSQANISPIFKKGDKTHAENYRPISLTSVPCKVMERLARDEFLDYLCLKNLISPSQHGFVYSKSCATNLLEAFDAITAALSNNFEVIILLLDFLKAFDKVVHDLLLEKMRAYGFGVEVINWTKAFLSNRTQRVVIGKAVSDWRDVLSGVPQGSVLGPLLFLIFINDMPTAASHLCKLFADDTKLIAVIKNDQDKAQLQLDIDALVNWSKSWLMSFNEGKCKVLFFEKKKSNELNLAFHCADNDDPNCFVDPHNRHQRFTMQDSFGMAHILEESIVERDLGIQVDNRLDWSFQIDHAKAKAYAALGRLKRTFVNWTPYTFRILFSVFVRPHLEFCATVWSPSNIGDIASLESVQKKATKLVPSIKSLHYADRLAVLKLPTLEHRRIRGDLIQFFKCQSGINKVKWSNPPLPHPSLSANGPASNIRGHDHRIIREAVSNSNHRENFLTNRVTHRWNQLPSDIVNATSTQMFKNRLDAFIENNNSFI